jgi:hypothetical protein
MPAALAAAAPVPALTAEAALILAEAMVTTASQL